MQDFLSLILFFCAALLVIALPILALRYYLLDKKAKTQSIPILEPPANLPPIALGMALDGRIEMRDILAEIVYLANLGYVEIYKEKNTLFFSRKQGTEPISRFDANFLDKFFSGLSTIPQDFVFSPSSGILNSLKSLLLDYLYKEIYPKYYDKKQTKIVNVGYTIGIISYFFMFIFDALFLPFFIIGILLTSTTFMFQKHNQAGNKLKQEIYGFIHYLETAELDRLHFHNDPKISTSKFDELLPYAIALGLEKKWAKMFGEFKPSSHKNPLIYAPDGVMQSMINSIR